MMNNSKVIVLEKISSINWGSQVELQSIPLGWYEVLTDAIIQSRGHPSLFSWKLILKKNVVYIWSLPNFMAVLTGLLKNDNIFVCWGLPKNSSSMVFKRLKLWKLRKIIKYSTVILTNDEITFADLISLGCKNPIFFPYVVDSDFFQFSPYQGRDKFLLMPGDNDRDEWLINQIALLTPYKVIRVTRDPQVLQFYHKSQDHNSKVEVHFNVSFCELRDLYQRTCAVVIPITTNNHAAGQTTLLEAIACGAPVLISFGRASSIAKEFETVMEVRSNKLESWIPSIHCFISRFKENNHLLLDAAHRIAESHHPRVVADKLTEIIKAI